MLDLIVDVGSVLATVAVLVLLFLRACGILGHRPVRRPAPHPAAITPGTGEAPASIATGAGPVPAGGEAPGRVPAFA